MTFFNNGPQYGSVTQVGRDQYISGDHYYGPVTVQAARTAVFGLRDAVTATPLAGSAAADASAQVRSIEEEMRRHEPDKGHIAGLVERLTKILTKAGALVQGAETLIRPLRTLAGWLGALGVPILGLLAVV